MNGGSWFAAAVALGCALAFSHSANAAEVRALSETAGVRFVTAQPDAENGPAGPGERAAGAEKAASPGCVKVKVVYAGYGEAARAGCAGGGSQ